MFAAFAATAVVSFAAGVALHKYVIAKAVSIKDHVTAAETRIHAEFEAVKSQLASLKKL
jgi:hypothetical protein